MESVCFADFMLNFSQEKIEYYQIPEALLKRFKIKTEEQLKKLCERFELAFTK